MADETPVVQEKQPEKPAEKPKAKDERDPNAVPEVNLREARLAESALVAESGQFTTVINGPDEDPYRGIDPAFLY